jgi:hypothetical protein
VIEVVYKVVQIVDLSAFFVSTLNRPRGAIGIVEPPIESTEQLRHRQICFTMAVIGCRIYEDRPSLSFDHIISSPEVPVKNGGLRLRRQNVG